MFLILNVISFLQNSLAVVYLSYDGLSGCEIEHCFSMTGLAAILDSIGLPDWASKLCLPCCYYYIKSFSICFDCDLVYAILIDFLFVFLLQLQIIIKKSVFTKILASSYLYMLQFDFFWVAC